MVARPVFRVLVFNPNTSTAITNSFAPALSKLDLPSLEASYWTCPTGPSIIKTNADLLSSAAHCLPHFLSFMHSYDGFLAACYAEHPIVELLRGCTDKPVVGIFEASMHAAVQLVGNGKKSGIITTGSAFEALLADGVERLLRQVYTTTEHAQKLFGGVVASDIGADDLTPETCHRAEEKIKKATRTLLHSGEVDTICVGGVILAGMEDFIRQACVEELGFEVGGQVKIIEQLSVGAIVLDAMLRKENCVDFTPALR